LRIAISGTHCSGKTTLVEDFIATHGDYVHEPEPYEWLEDVYGEAAAEELTVEQVWRQLELCAERLRTYGSDARVIAERSPVDFLAYMLALSDLGRTGRDCELIASAAEVAAVGFQHIDLLVVVPLNVWDGIVAPESEDLPLRNAMNDRLLELIDTDEYALFGDGSLRVVEIQGNRGQRMELLEQAVSDSLGVNSSVGPPPN
jgi:hypothetical protein